MAVQNPGAVICAFLQGTRHIRRSYSRYPSRRLPNTPKLQGSWNGSSNVCVELERLCERVFYSPHAVVDGENNVEPMDFRP
jgi:hypothetical protein